MRFLEASQIEAVPSPWDLGGWISCTRRQKNGVPEHQHRWSPLHARRDGSYSQHEKQDGGGGMLPQTMLAFPQMPQWQVATTVSLTELMEATGALPGYREGLEAGNQIPLDDLRGYSAHRSQPQRAQSHRSGSDRNMQLQSYTVPREHDATCRWAWCAAGLFVMWLCAVALFGKSSPAESVATTTAMYYTPMATTAAPAPWMVNTPAPLIAEETTAAPTTEAPTTAAPTTAAPTTAAPTTAALATTAAPAVKSGDLWAPPAGTPAPVVLAVAANPEQYKPEEYVEGVVWDDCNGLLQLNVGVLATDDATGSIVIQGPLPGCYMPNPAFESVIRSAIARAKVSSVMTEPETNTLVSPDEFYLSDYEPVFVNFLSDVELDEDEWMSFTGQSYKTVPVEDGNWIRRRACGFAGCGFQVGNPLQYDEYAPQSPGGGAYDFIHNLMTLKQELPNGSQRKRLVFFHCASGVDRAGTVSLSYKMAIQHMSLPQAVSSLHAAKTYQALPNNGFQVHLMLWCYGMYRTTDGFCAIPGSDSGWAVQEYPEDLSGRNLPTPRPYSTTTTLMQDGFVLVHESMV